jgi:hypothetical protein
LTQGAKDKNIPHEVKRLKAHGARIKKVISLQPAGKTAFYLLAIGLRNSNIQDKF